VDFMASWGSQYGGKGMAQMNGKQGSRMDLYFASLPNNWDETEIKAFHQDIGCDATDISSIKLLPRRAGLNSRAAIVRYITHAAAERALRNCKGSAGSMEVRFADEKQDKFGGKGAGNRWPGSAGGHGEDQSVPVTNGLRVRNLGNGQTGSVVACRGRTPGTFRVLFDNGQEWEWEVKRFESEDGWPLLDVETVPATINLRVRCWMDGRCGRIAYIHNDWPQRIWVEFDDGESGEKDATWFVSEDNSVPVGPGHTEKEWMQGTSKGGKGSGNVPANSWDWGKSAGTGASGKGGKSRYSRDEDYGWSEGWKDKSHSKGGYNSQDAWWESEMDYSNARRAAKGTERSKGNKPASEEQKGKAMGAKGAGKKGGKESSELEETALREVIDQLLDESNAGRVWITNWPGRFQSTFGQLRDFLLRHPDKFTIVPEGYGRRFTVAFAGGEPPASAKAKAKAKAKVKAEAKPKGRSLKWTKAKKSSDEADGAGTEVQEDNEGKEEKEEDKENESPPRSTMRRTGDEADTGATAFEEAEDSDDPVEDAMCAREDDAEKDKQAEES